MRQTSTMILVGTTAFAFLINLTAIAVPPNEIDVSAMIVPPFLPMTTTPNSSDVIDSTSETVLVDDCTLQTFTGNDECSLATIQPLAVGLFGSPNMITISGDSTLSTGPDACDLNMWWEAFSLSEPAEVTIDYCCSPIANVFAILFNTCPTSNVCLSTDIVSNDMIGNGPPVCDSANTWYTILSLAPGTYYVPVFAATPYQMHISAVERSGSCCDLLNGTCVETQSASQCNGLFANSQWNAGISCADAGCTGACCNLDDNSCVDNQTELQCSTLFTNSKWSSGLTCLFAECDPPGASGFSSNNVTLLSHVQLSDFAGSPTAANDVWSYVSPSGREYALIGLECSVGIVEVTDPINPVVVGTVAGPCSLWRDMKVHGEFAYNVIEQTGNGIQIIDLTQVDSGTVSLSSTATLGGSLSSSHNIAYNPDSGFLYLAIPSINSGVGITAVDASDPINPVVAGTWLPVSGIRCHDLHVITYDTGIYAGREIAFCFGENQGFAIADVTDKQNMFEMSALDYPNNRYCHQGWTSEDRKFLFFGDELDERDNINVSNTTTYVVNIEDLNNPQIVTTFTNGKLAIDHNLIIRGDRVYEANYSTGLRIFDIVDPLNPVEVGFFDTFPADNRRDFVGLWGVDPNLPSGIILASDDLLGLFILRDDTAGPVARYTPSIGSPSAGDSVMFDGSLSLHPTPPRTIVSYEWDFSYDGLTFNVEDSGMVIPHTFTSSGTFSVALRVTDDDGTPKTNLIGKDMIVTGSPLLPPIDLPGELGFTKDRYISFDPSPNTVNVAYRVRRVGDATSWYVGCTLNDLGAEGLFSTLVQTPEFCSWSAVPGVHVNGCILVPGNEYIVEATGDDVTFGDPLSIFTTAPQFTLGRQFGDTTGGLIGGLWTAPDGLVSGNDIVAIIQKFTLAANAPHLPRMDNDGVLPNFIISGGDILRGVKAFEGAPFEFGVTDCLTGQCVPSCP